MTVAASGCLDNRDEVSSLLGARVGALSDEDLLHRAFLKWDEQCPRFLIGDWALAASFDHRFFLALGDGANHTFYYRADAAGLLFASDIHALQALRPAAIDDLYLAKFLTDWQPAHTETAYRQVARLAAFQQLVWTPAGVTLSRYWMPATAPVRRSSAEHAEGLREVLARALSNRLRRAKAVGSMLSAGLDSTAVTALAARDLVQHERRLIAFTAVPEFDVAQVTPRSQIGDEGTLAAAVAALHPNVDHARVACRGSNPLDAIRRAVRARGQPVRNAGNFVWLLAIQDAAMTAGLDLLLTAGGGNVAISWAGPRPHGITRLLNQGAAAVPRRLVRFSHRVAIDGWRRLKRPNGAPPWLRPTAIREAFARDTGLWAEMRTVGSSPAQRRRGGRDGFLETTLDRKLPVPGSLAFCDPTLNREVLTFAWSIPAVEWSEPIARGPIRQAMAGLVPDSVRLNRRRGHQSADIVFRLLAHRAAVDALFEEMRASTLVTDRVDLARCEGIWRTAQRVQTPETSREVANVLLRAMALGCFLIDFGG